MRLRDKYWAGALTSAMLAVPLLTSGTARAQDAKAIVQQAVNDQLEADREDHSHWRYIETEMDGSKFLVIETEVGAVKRHINDEGGRPASAETLATDDALNEKFLHDPALRAKQAQNAAHDDKSSIALLNLMPEAFDWTVMESNSKETTLSYKPKANFDPGDMEGRVMGMMSGTLVVTNPRHRIKTFKGRLMNDVNIGFGLLARIKAGSTFDIERREVSPGYWQIEQTHVHISGHALFFKTIGTQEDEVKSDFSLTPKGTTLEQAVEMLKNFGERRPFR